MITGEVAPGWPGLGFSPVGLAVAALVLAPNLLLVFVGPRGRAPKPLVPPVIQALEGIGQVACLLVPTATVTTAMNPAVLAAAGVVLVVYYAGWVRFLASGRRWASLYEPWGSVPVPMAITPVLVFLLAGIGLANLWVVAASLVLGAGHIPASLRAARVLAGG